MKTCDMCGRATSHFELRWYKYDNGDQSKETVCIPCADLHLELTGKASK